MREAKSIYTFYCDHCGTSKATGDLNTPEDMWEVNATPRIRNYLHLCGRCKASFCAMLDLLEIKYEVVGKQIRILSAIGR